MSELLQTRRLEQPKVETQRIATEKITGEPRRQQQTNQSEVQAAKPVRENTAMRELNRNDAANAARVSPSDHNNRPRDGLTHGLTPEADTKRATKEGPAVRGPAAEGTTTAAKPKEGLPGSKKSSSTPQEGRTIKAAVAEGQSKRNSVNEGTGMQGARKEGGKPTAAATESHTTAGATREGKLAASTLQEVTTMKGAVAEDHHGGSLATEGGPIKPTEGLQTEKGRFRELRDDINNHDWVKELDGKVQIFYGGVYTDGRGHIAEPAWQRADREKLHHGRLTTINDTYYGKKIEESKGLLSEGQRNELWSIASRKYAEAADANFSKGITPVGYVKWAGLESDHLTVKRSDFEQVEWPRLRGLMTDEPVQGAKFEMWPDYYPKDKNGGPLPQ